MPDRFRLADAEFDDQSAAGDEQRRRGRGDRPIGIQPVGPAIQRRARVEVPHFGGERSDVARGDVGRVGHDDREWSAQRRRHVARDNARRLALTRARFVACNMAAALRGPFAVIVSNPPYIASGDIAALAPEVRDFDPRAALDGGPDGLDSYRAIAATAPALLVPGGALIVELGIGQAEPVGHLFAAAGLAPSPPHPDLNGTLRAFVARKRA